VFSTLGFYAAAETGTGSTGEAGFDADVLFWFFLKKFMGIFPIDFSM
jgi:hypothetical protein